MKRIAVGTIVGLLSVLGGSAAALAEPVTLPTDPSAPAAATPAVTAPAVTTGSIDVDPPFEQRMKDCMAIWDKGTHMTKDQWRRSCQTTLRSLETN